MPFGGTKKDAEGPNPNVNPPGAATSPDTVNDARAVYPCTIHHNGRLGGLYTLYAETAQARLEWKAKLEEAIGLRKVVQESNKVFEVETLSVDTFFAPTLMANAGPSWNNDGNFTGKVTCSVPFSKWSWVPSHVLVLTFWGGSYSRWSWSRGYWMRGRSVDWVQTRFAVYVLPLPSSPFFLTLGVCLAMRRVLHLRMVSQCAMLEDFGIFLVLADKVRLGRSSCPECR